MDARTSSRYRATQRKRGLRPVVLWLPDVNDPTYRARLAEECRGLAQLTPDEDAMPGGFARLAARTEGRR
ncbi:MAG TPA: antitoxin MazE-like protein [Acetobacteraceae bacterium]|nr:antitoxin MazE-like protein [Acetobacteraceae bacterium]